MMLGTRFLVPLDGSKHSERAAGMAARLAAATAADIELLSIVGSVEEIPPRERYLEEVAAQAAGAPTTPVRYAVRSGLKIEREVEESIGADTTIVMTTGATLGPHAGHIGSVAERVVRASSRPALLIGPKAEASIDDIERVVVCLDGSAAAERAVPVGCQLAGILGAQVWLVTVASPQQVAAANAYGPIIESGYLRVLAKHACPSFDVEYEVLHRNDPAEGIADFLGANDLPVLATHGRSGLGRLAAGSVTTTVVRAALRPVAVVPPLGAADDALAETERKG